MALFNYVSADGSVLPFVGENYVVYNIDKQTEASTSISGVTVGGIDGDDVTNVQANPRTIVLDIFIASEVEKTKRKILDVIKIKQTGKIVWEQDGRELEISGIVESIEMPRWTNSVTMQVTLHCSQPFWENVDWIISEINESINLHYFTDMPDDMLYFLAEGIPFGEYDTMRTKSFHNFGDVSVGLEIEIIAHDTVTNPIIYNENGKYFGCGYGTGSKVVTMSAGDVIKINTRKNEKAVTLNGVSILGKIKPSSTWLQLEAGNNTFSINSDDASTSNMSFSLMYKQKYI